jgi:signal transduction histidine kinase
MEQGRVYQYNTFDSKYNIFDSSNLLEDIGYGNYGIYYDILRSKENNKLEPSEIFLEEDKDININVDNNDQMIIKDNRPYTSVEDFTKTNFNENFDTYRRRIDLSYKNLEYYAIKKDSNIVEERREGNIDILASSQLIYNAIEELKTKYDFYLVIDYNENGIMTIRDIYGLEKASSMERLKTYTFGGMYKFKNNSIKNMTYVYAVPKDLKYSDILTNYKESFEENSIRRVIENYTIIIVLLTLLFGLIVPYNFSKELVGFNWLSKNPVEIIGFAIFVAIMIGFNETNYLIIHTTMKGDLTYFTQMGINKTFAAAIIDFINIAYWVLAFTIIFIGTVMIKHILKTGIKAYITGNSLIYKILKVIWVGCKRVLNYIKNVDLKDGNTKKITLILIINLIILCLICSLWFLGIIAALIYTVIVFVKIRRYYNQISNNYRKLFEATSQLAEGKLEINIEEDLGIFNGYRNELLRIQKSFKKAVNEEVKSQRMKTELITNVSHDLKTPLTAIITYVDLLKDEVLSVEKRREYLDTLDRKSQRLKDLIEDLFEVSKASSGNVNLNIVDVDVVALIKQTLLELEDKISEAALIMKTSYPEEKLLLPLDSQRMFRVFENLITNITKYSMSGTRVYIEVIDKGDKVEISLKNIAADEINFSADEILERFVRGDKARNTEGSGLGLAIAKSFVELQGGKFEIEVEADLFKVQITFNKG